MKLFKVTKPANKFYFMILLVSIMMIYLSGCNSDPSPASNGDKKINVTTTIGMITDITKQIGGEHVIVTGLMQPGVDPHLYKASQGDLAKLENADIIFYNGLHLEGKLAEILENLEKKKPTIPVTKNIDTSKLRSSSDGVSVYDPHVWFNVRHWMSAAETIGAELALLDPQHADQFKSNTQTYLQELEKLDIYTKEQIASIPESSRVLVTAHDAFGYFGDAYNIKVMGLQGISTASEYGSKDVIQLRDYLVANQIKAVFVESSVPKKAIEAVIEGAKEKGHEVKIGGELFSDAMGNEGTPEGTYLGMVRHNVDTIVKALK